MKPGDFVEFEFKGSRMVGEIVSTAQEASAPARVVVRPKRRGRWWAPVDLVETDLVLIHPGTPDFPQMGFGV